MYKLHVVNLGLSEHTARPSSANLVSNWEIVSSDCIWPLGIHMQKKLEASSAECVF